MGFQFKSATRAVLIGLGLVTGVTAAGCAQPMYWYGRKSDSLTPYEESIEPAVIVGGPLPRMDATQKVLFWPQDQWEAWRGRRRQAKGEELRPQATTTQDAVVAAVEYLKENNLNDVIVEARHHDPVEQWKRLQANPHIHPVWKYTDGSMRVLSYSLMPPRLFRSDSYNPYTNTLSINSSSRASAIYEAARVKVTTANDWPGAYATSRYIPLVPVGHNVQVTSDALAYARTREDDGLEKEMMGHSYASIGGSAVANTVSLATGFVDTQNVGITAVAFTGSAVGSLAGYGAASLASRRTEGARKAR